MPSPVSSTRRSGRGTAAFFGSVVALVGALGLSSLGPADARSSGADPRASQAASGATIDPAILSNLAWRNVGPVLGGRSTAVAGSVSRPNEYYMGAVGAGLWKTTNGGASWSPVTDGFLTSSSVGAVAACEADPDVVYIGTGEVQWRDFALQGDGVYKSTDGGETWTHIGLAETQTIARVRVDPTDCDRVFAAAFGNPFEPNPERGVFRSTDGGESWERVLFVDSQTGASDLVIDPNNADVLYAGFWHALMRPWGGQDGGPGSGLYKSVDGGTTWTNLTDNPGMPGGTIGKVGVAVSGADSNRVYAMISARQDPNLLLPGPDKGLYVSDDAGATWRKVNDHGNLTARPHYYTRVVADPLIRDRVWVLSDSLSRSNNGGQTFQTVNAPHGDHHDLWIAPNNSNRMINGNDGGANVTTNGGPPWTAQTYSTAQMYNVATTNDDPYLICSGQQERNAICVRSDSTGAQVVTGIGGCETAHVAVDPRNSNVFYAGCYGGSTFTRRDRSLPASIGTQRIDVWPTIPFGHAPKDLRDRFAWSFPIETTPTYPSAVYTSSQYVYRTTNGGQSWQRLSPDLTRADPATLELPFGPVFFHPNSSYTYATISAIAPSPLHRRVIWAGSDDGLVHVTRNGGDTWSNVTPPEMEPFTHVFNIGASSHDLGTAYVAGNRYRLGDRTPYIFKTTDDGRTWATIVDGIPDGDFVYVVREDPTRPGLLYAGTEHGVYVSLNGGEVWQSLRQNLPDTPVRDLVVKNDDLVIATFGRGFYVMDDLTPLRELVPAGASAAGRQAGSAGAAAEASGTASAFRESSAPERRPQATQRQQQQQSFQLFDPVDPIRRIDSGVRVVYLLTEPAATASLEFLDQDGNLITALTGNQVPRTAGEHAVTWNLRYPGPTLFPGIQLRFVNTLGPLAPWGNYRVRLTVDGESQTQAFTILGDPRLKGIGPGHIRDQFTLAKATVDRTSEANEGVIGIRDCRGQIQARIAAASDSQVTEQGEHIVDALGVIERALYQTELQQGVSWEGVEPLRLNNEFLYLRGIIETAEDRPSEQARAVFDVLSERLDRELAGIDALLQNEVAAFNQLLQQRGLQPVSCSRGGGQ